MNKKRIGLMLFGFLLCTMIFMVEVEAESIEEEKKSEIKQILSEFGIEANEPDDYIDPEQSAPLGSDIVVLDPIDELYIGMPDTLSYIKAPYINSTQLFGANTIEKTNNFRKDMESKINIPKLDKDGDEYIYFKGVGLCLDYENAKKSHTATLAMSKKQLSKNGNSLTCYQLDLIVMNALTGDKMVVTILDKEDEFANPKSSVYNEPYFIKYSANSYTSFPELLYSYLAIDSGDFDGDGIDEIVVYVPDKDEPRVEVFNIPALKLKNNKMAWMKQDYWNMSMRSNGKSMYTELLGIIDHVPNMVDFGVGDVNNDGVDDLGITWGSTMIRDTGKYYLELIGHDGVQNMFYARAGKSRILLGKWKGNVFQEQFDISLGDSNSANGYQYRLYKCAIEIGDIDGDEIDEIVIGGQPIGNTKIWSGSYKYWVLMWEYVNKLAAYTSTTVGKYDFDDFSEVKKTHGVAVFKYDFEENTINYKNGCTFSREDHQWIDQEYLNNLSMITNMVVFKPSLLDDSYKIYMDGMILGADFDSIYPEELIDESCFVKTQLHERNGANIGYNEYDAKAIDVDSDGNDEIVIGTSFNKVNYGHGWNADSSQIIVIETDRKVNSDKNTVGESVVLMNDPNAKSFVIAALDVDEDSIRLKYEGNHYFGYTKPKILAVIAAPPLFGDLAHLDDGDNYIGNSETSFSNTSATSSAHNKTLTVSGGVIVSLEIEAADVNVFESETDIQVHLSHTYENQKEITSEVDMTTSGLKDMVVLYSVPVELFIYKNVDTNKYVGIPIPYDSVVRHMSVEEYDKISLNYDELNPVRGNSLLHEPGKPNTYLRSPYIYEDWVVKSKENYGVSVGSDMQITQVIDVNEEVVHSHEHALDINQKFIFGGVAGYSFGIEKASGWSNGTLEGHSATGTIRGIPNDAKGLGYDYTWKMIMGKYIDGDDEYYVSNYLLDNLSVPPELPKEFKAVQSTKKNDEIIVSWICEDEAVSGYQLYRHMDITGFGVDIKLGEVIPRSRGILLEDGSLKFTYIDSNLDEQKIYMYKIQSLSNDMPLESVLSQIAVVRTYAANEQMTVTLNSEVINMHPDQREEIVCEIDSDYINLTSVFYQWQKKESGEWVDIKDENKDTMVFKDVTSIDSGEYRCWVIRSGEDYALSYFSEPAMVNVSKRSAKLMLDTTEDNGKLGVRFQVIKAEVESDCVLNPIGVVCLNILNEDENMEEKVFEIDSETGLTEYIFMEENFYELEATYSGDDVFGPESIYQPISGEHEIGYTISFGEDIEKRVFSFEDEIPIDVMKTTNGQWEVVTLQSEITSVVASYYDEDKGSWESCNNMIKKDSQNAYIINPSRLGTYKVSVKGVIDSDDFTLQRLLEVVKKELDLTIEPAVLNIKEGDIIMNTVLKEELTNQLENRFLELDDSIDSLGISLVIENRIGMRMGTTMTKDIVYGSYYIFLEFDETHKKARQGYKIIDNKVLCLVTGPTYHVDCGARDYNGMEVGSVSPLMADTFRDSSTLITAIPDIGYKVKDWIIDSDYYELEKISDNQIEVYIKPELLGSGVEAFIEKPVAVEVIFDVAFYNLNLDPVNGMVRLIDPPQTLGNEGEAYKVSEGSQFSFVAVPNDGYVMNQWLIKENGVNTIVEGFKNVYGQDALVYKMNGTDTVVSPIFKRKEYKISLSDNLVGSYETLTNSSEIATELFIESQNVSGDTIIRIQPKDGYKLEAGSNWMINGSNMGEENSVEIQVKEDTKVTCTLVAKDINVTVLKDWSNEVESTDSSMLDHTELNLLVDDNLVDHNDSITIKSDSTVELRAIMPHELELYRWELLNSNNEHIAYRNGNKIKMDGISEDIIIQAIFRPKKEYKLMISSDTHGKIVYNINGGEMKELTSLRNEYASVMVYEGDTITVQGKPEKYYMIGGWQCDDLLIQEYAQEVVIDNIEENYELAVYFVPRIYHNLKCLVTGDLGVEESLVLTPTHEGGYTIDTETLVGQDTQVSIKLENIYDSDNLGNYYIEGWLINSELLIDDQGKAITNTSISLDRIIKDTEVEVILRVKDY